MNNDTNNEIWPTFLIIGAGKSGTTSLYRYLAEHPDVYMSPKKEANFFAFENQLLNFKGLGDEQAKNTSITSRQQYTELFSGVSGQKAIGEASPAYLYYPNSAKRIHQYIPEVKLIAVLRQPVDRAYSCFMMMRRSGRESCVSFEDALKDQQRRQDENWGSATYLEEGYYYELLSRYYEYFDRSQIKVYLYEDLVSDVKNVYADLCRFIGVDPTFEPGSFVKHNVSGIPKYRWLHQWLTKRGGVKSLGKYVMPTGVRQKVKSRVMNSNLQKIALPGELRNNLTSAYRDDIFQLQGLIDRDLSHWIE